MPSVSSASQYIFVGSYAFPPSAPVSDATFYSFIGASAFPPLVPVSSASFYAFVGEVEFNSLATVADTSFYTFNKINASAGPAVGTGIVLYPISEDPNQRPSLRY